MLSVLLCYYGSPEEMGLLDPDTSDGRVIFFLPWQKLTIAGTTDTPCAVTHSPAPTEKDISFILQEVKHYLNPDLEGMYFLTILLYKSEDSEAILVLVFLEFWDYSFFLRNLPLNNFNWITLGHPFLHFKCYEYTKIYFRYCTHLVSHPINRIF
jgi:hypothetical protein